MVEKAYDWENGAELLEHSRRKHKILEEYFRDYLRIRTKFARRESFRLVVVDGFSGAGKYACGSNGSPLIFINTLRDTINSVNEIRSIQNTKKLKVECLFIFNDCSNVAINELSSLLNPLITVLNKKEEFVKIKLEFLNCKFEEAYPKIKRHIYLSGITNIIFNLDQCGYSRVSLPTIKDALSLGRSSEVFLTFAIETLKTFLSNEARSNSVPLDKLFGGELPEQFLPDELVSRKDWLGLAEKAVFDALKSISEYVCPFSINNPDGWRYWLIHFSNNHRARQAYNDVLHDNSSMQAHFGRSGLNMLSYDPRDEGALYFFDSNGRARAQEELQNDIPKLVHEAGGAVTVEQFFKQAYSATPAHSDDINSVLVGNDELEVKTLQGGSRRVSGQIKTSDLIQMKKQRTFYPLFEVKKTK